MFRLIKNYIHKNQWKRLHPDSMMIPVNRFDYDRVQIGRYSYGDLCVIDFGGESILKIGDFVSVAQHVSFILNAEHNTRTISTYPFKTKLLKVTRNESFGKGDIIIGDDVWIGYGAIIMSGIKIGQGAIVAAGAVVTKDIPPYAIAGGVPAKVISYRFQKNDIDYLTCLDYKKLSEDAVKEHIEELYLPYNDSMDLEWFPKKGIIKDAK